MRNSKNNKQGNQTRPDSYRDDKDREVSPKGNKRSERTGEKMKGENEEVSKPYDEDVAAEMSIRSGKSKQKTKS